MNFTNYLKAFAISFIVMFLFGFLEQLIGKDLAFASGWFSATGFFLTLEYLEKTQELNKNKNN